MDDGAAMTREHMQKDDVESFDRRLRGEYLSERQFPILHNTCQLIAPWRDHDHIIARIRVSTGSSCRSITNSRKRTKP
ncbi:MAG TPA: hypothetical protein DC031_10445 [Sulfitobacter sp.]|nr:hypothetical protein [Sulfitobacter sp.]HBB83671.1 hypothetical protein [Sulfitobacter sp.]